MQEGKKNIVITGAAGNLGGMLAKSLVNDDANLRLFWHKKPINEQIAKAHNIETCNVDLADKHTFEPYLNDVDVIVHFAGVLFKNNPERFLPTTNTQYFKNLIESAVEAGVKRIILISFPHVEGETTPLHPAQGRLDGPAISEHAKTRLQEEQILFSYKDDIEAVSLRVGMVYGRGILMIDAAKWLSKHWLLGVWRKPTYIHLISKIDFIETVRSAMYRPDISGIYHVGDDGVQTLQEFLSLATATWNTKQPWIMPLPLIYAAAYISEVFSRIFGCKAPLTRDFITIGRVSYYGDTHRMRKELLPKLKYRTFFEGISTL